MSGKNQRRSRCIQCHDILKFWGSVLCSKRPKTYSAARAAIFRTSDDTASLVGFLWLMETLGFVRCHAAHELLECRHTNSATCSFGRDMKTAQKVLLEVAFLGRMKKNIPQMWVVYHVSSLKEKVRRPLWCLESEFFINFLTKLAVFHG